MRPRAPALHSVHRSVSGAGGGRESGRNSTVRSGCRVSSTCTDHSEADADKQSDTCGSSTFRDSAAARERKRRGAHQHQHEQSSGRRKRTRHKQQSECAATVISSKSRAAFFRRLQSTLAARREQLLEFLV